MFRAERPQRGRYRQFLQLGAEIFGDAGPGCDAEMIDMLVGFLARARASRGRGARQLARRADTRERYREALVAAPHAAQRRSSRPTRSAASRTNPLRILDSKDPRDQAAVRDAPTIREFLDAGDRAHFARLRRTSTRSARPTRSTRDSCEASTTTRARFSRSRARTTSSAPAARSSAAGATTAWSADLGGPEVPPSASPPASSGCSSRASSRSRRESVDALVAPLGRGRMAPALAAGATCAERRSDARSTRAARSLKSQLRRANTLRRAWCSSSAKASSPTTPCR